MLIEVKLYGTLRRLSNKETPGLWQGEVPAGIRIYDLIRILGTKEAEVAAAAMNGEPCELDVVIPAGAVITLVTPFGGG